MSSEIKVERAYYTLLDMLKDRGYHITDEHKYNDEKNEDIKPYSIKAQKMDDIIICFITDDEKLNIQGIKDKISILNKENATRCIIVYKSSITSSAKKSLETVNYIFELFSLLELQFNITKHRLVPRHEQINDIEKEELKNYKGKLPILLHTDAIARYYAFNKGDIIRITRKNGSIVYRVVK